MTSSMYCSSTRTYEMLGMHDIPNTYGDLSSEQGTMQDTYNCKDKQYGPNIIRKSSDDFDGKQFPFLI